MAISKVTSGGIADGTLSVEDIKDDAVTAAKLANSINTDIATGVTGNTTANAALPKAGGAMTGALTVNAAAVFNETSADVDFRVESNTKTHALEVNGASGVVGIGCHETVDNLNLNFYGEGTNSTCIIHGDNDGGDVMIAMANSSNHNSSDESLSLHLQPASLGKGVLLRAHREGNFDSAANSSASFELIVNKANTAISALKVDTSGNVNINAGDLFFGTAGKGIVLGATTNVDANTLDDYEEGVWTPTLIGTGGGTGTWASSVNTYTKVGRAVHITAYLNCTSLGNMSNAITIGGLPFTNASAGGYQALATGAATGLAIDAGNCVTAFINVNATTIHPRLWNATTGTAAYGFYIEELSADGSLMFSGTYFAT